MRRELWIVWLMLALLPLRGWAVVGMALPQAAQHGAASVAMADASAQTQGGAMPCHRNADDTQGTSSCQACDACHAAMGTAPAKVEPGVAALAEAPRIAAMRDTGRPAMGGLERPPRSLLG